MVGTGSVRGFSQLCSSKLRLVAGVIGLTLLAACAAAPPPVVVAPALPPPPPVQYVPARPAPPGGAAAMMAIPAVGLDGTRLTVNTGLTAAQTTWNLRSALNVAALNCDEPQYAAILGNYSSFLDRFERPLRATSGKVLEEFRAKHGRSAGQSHFDNYMTQVYNYFALPPAIGPFCNAALAVSTDSTLVAVADLDSFAARALPQLEAVFDDFFRSYENYERNLASWNATYGFDAIPGTALPAGFRTGSLGSTAGEQVLFRETPQGQALPPSAGTGQVLTTPTGRAPEPAAAPVVVAQLPAAGEPLPELLPTLDPGASDVAPDPAAPAASGGIVFTSNPVVQAGPEGDE